MDGDRIEPSMLMRFTEFFALIGIVFTMISVVYFPSRFAMKRIQRM